MPGLSPAAAPADTPAPPYVPLSRAQLEDILGAGFFNAFDHAAIGMALADLHRRCLAANLPLCAMLEYDEDELLGRTFQPFTAPDDLPENLSLGQRLLSGEIPSFVLEKRYISKSGRIINVLLSAALIHDAAGQPWGVMSQLQDISARKQAEEALQQNEELYRTLVETSPDAIAMTDPTGTILFCNAQHAALYGYERPEDMVGLNSMAFFAPQERTHTRAKLELAVEIGPIRQAEYTLFRKDGSTFIAEFSVTPIYGVCGHARAHMGVVRDITARKQAEQDEREQRLLAEALRDSAAALSSALSLDEVLERLLTNASRVVPNDAVNIMLVDAPRNEVYVTRAQGYDKWGAGERVKGLRINLDRLHHLQQLMVSGQPLIIPDVTTDPEWVTLLEWGWLRSYAAAPIRARGKTVGFVNFDSAIPAFFNAAHIERLQAFADQAAVAVEKAQLFEATQRSVQRLTLLHQAALELAKIESTEELYNEILRLACTLARATRAALTLYDGKEHLRTVAVVNVPAEVVGSRIRLGEGLSGSVAQSRQPMHMRNYQQWEGRLLTYSTLGIVSMVAFPLIWQEQLVGTLLVAEEREREFDDDDMHMLELFASLAAAALEQHHAVADAQLRESEANALSARLSHAQEEERVRIAEQLHDTIGYRMVTLQKSIEMTLATLGADHALAEHLTRHLEGLKETHQLARSLAMDLDSKVLADLGISPAARQYVDRLAASTGMNVRLHVTGRVRRLPADVERVAFRSLQETVNNALRHASATEIAAQLHFGGRYLRLTVQDNGRGFDAERLNNRAVAAPGSPLGSTALGLPELRRQVRLIKGELLVESAPGQGVTIVLNLPIHPTWTQEKANPRVLLVDDHEVTRQGLRLQLAQSGEFTCIGEASDGVSALHQVEVHRPDLVLLDIQLPTLGGIETTRQITLRHPHVGVVILTGYEEEAYLQQALEAGARGYVLKCDESHHIIQALRAVHEGETYVSPQLAVAWARLRDRVPSQNPLDPLTMREREVFQLIITGQRSRAIAATLGLSVRTIEFYRKNIMGKLGVKNLPELLQFAMRHHMIAAPPALPTASRPAPADL